MEDDKFLCRIPHSHGQRGVGHRRGQWDPVWVRSRNGSATVLLLTGVGGSLLNSGSRRRRTLRGWRIGPLFIRPVLCWLIVTAVSTWWRYNLRRRPRLPPRCPAQRHRKRQRRRR